MNDETITTTELRWFFDGELPAEVAAWLASDELSPHQPLFRGLEHHYLWTGEDDVSLKLRGSELERKQRTGRRAFSHQGAEGWVESWRKESRHKEPHDDVRPLVTIVYKKRRSLLFTEKNGRIVGIDDPAGRPPIVVELASLAVPAHRAWTFCIEANEGHEHQLEGVVAHVMASFPTQAASLEANRSMGYPGWLLDHAREPRLSGREVSDALPDFAR